MPRPPTTPPGNVAASGLLPARSPSERKVDERTGHDVLAEHATKAKREVSPRDPPPPPSLPRLRMRARTHKRAHHFGARPPLHHGPPSAVHGQHSMVPHAARLSARWVSSRAIHRKSTDCISAGSSCHANVRCVSRWRVSAPLSSAAGQRVAHKQLYVNQPGFSAIFRHRLAEVVQLDMRVARARACVCLRVARC